MNEMRTIKFDIWHVKPGVLGLVIKKNRHLSNKINKFLIRYPADIRFSNEDEPAFFFLAAQIESIRSLLNIKG